MISVEYQTQEEMYYVLRDSARLVKGRGDGVTWSWAT